MTAVESGGMPASLVTANGNSSGNMPGIDLTHLANVHPNITPTQAAPIVAITNSPNPGSAIYGISVTFIATVTGATTEPTGSLTFTDTSTNPGTDICTSVLLSQGASSNISTASCPTSTLAVGTHSIKATYTPDGASSATYPGAISPTFTQNVTSPTALALAPATGTSVVNQSISITASIVATTTGAANPNTGSVTFTVTNGTQPSESETVNVVNGSATFTNSLLPGGSNGTLLPGLNKISADYADPADNYGASSGTAYQSVTAGATTVTLSSSSTASAGVDGSLTEAATVTQAVPASGTLTGSLTPTGTISFSATPTGASSPITQICIAQVSASTGQATCTENPSTFSAGTYSVTGVFTPTAGTNNFTSSPASSSSALSIGKSDSGCHCELVGNHRRHQ